MADTDASKLKAILRSHLAVGIIMVGILVMLYPILASHYNNYRQQEHAHEFNSEINDLPAQALQTQFEAAQKYNAALSENAYADPWGGAKSKREHDAKYQAYLKQLSLLNPMATVRIPRLSINLPLYHGTSEATLSHGLGHLYGTALPVGGVGTRAAITGHTGLSTATLFDRLTEIKNGDVFFVDVSGQTLKYQVSLIEVVEPEELQRLHPIAGRDLITLITCTPYAVNSHRLLVTGERIPLQEPQDLQDNPPPYYFIWRPWMSYMLIALALGLASGRIMRWWTTYRRRKNQEPLSPHGNEDTETVNY